MPRVRKIRRRPDGRLNYYVVDACFLANKHIPEHFVPAGRERDRVQATTRWWKEIEAQLDSGSARVYIPDVCIAEAFKVLAKKYYVENWFPSWRDFNKARSALSSVSSRLILWV